VTVAFVLSGGASLGAVEVGMLKALAQRGITPDLIVGTSVGAVNGAWLAGHPEADVIELERVWASIHRSTVFPADPMLGLFAFAGRRPGLVPQHGLRSLVQGHLTFERIEEAPIPLHLVAVEVLTGQDIRCRDHRWMPLAPSAAGVGADEPIGPHQASDPLSPNAVPVAAELTPHPWRTVGAARLAMDPAYRCKERIVRDYTRRRFTSGPRVEARPAPATRHKSVIRYSAWCSSTNRKPITGSSPERNRRLPSARSRDRSPAARSASGTASGPRELLAFRGGFEGFGEAFG
jgi:hypothetical protein